MTRLQKLLPLLLIIIVTLTACPPPEHGVSLINIKQGNDYIKRFRQANMETFANEYSVDLEALGALDGDDISMKIFHAIDEAGNKIFIIAPATEDGSIIQEGPFFKQSSICPPMCDREMTRAEPINIRQAMTYISVYDEATDDEQISSFQITPSMLESMRNQGATGLKIYHGLDRSDRVLVVMGLGDDLATPMTNLVYKVDKSRLCPQMCDVIGTASPR